MRKRRFCDQAGCVVRIGSKTRCFEESRAAHALLRLQTPSSQRFPTGVSRHEENYHLCSAGFVRGSNGADGQRAVSATARGTDNPNPATESAERIPATDNP